jgi:hypothetical protein
MYGRWNWDPPAVVPNERDHGSASMRKAKSFDFGFGPPASSERLAMAGRDCGLWYVETVNGEQSA